MLTAPKWMSCRDRDLHRPDWRTDHRKRRPELMASVPVNPATVERSAAVFTRLLTLVFAEIRGSEDVPVATWLPLDVVVPEFAPV